MLPFTRDRSSMNKHCMHRPRQYILMLTMPVTNMMRKSFCFSFEKRKTFNFNFQIFLVSSSMLLADGHTVSNAPDLF